MLRVNLTPRCGLVVTGCTRTSAAQCTVSALCEERGETCGDEGVCVRPEVVPEPFDGDATAPRRDGATDAALDRPAPDGSPDAQEPMDSGVAEIDARVDTGVDGGVCIANTQTDPMNCGACGNRCPAAANATPACAMGSCALTCASGFADCDRSAGNGCEARLDTEMNCGACGTSCSGATPVCSMNRCASGCAGTETRCGGACVNTASNTAHCGRCDNPCPARPNATASCAAGACAIVCNASFANCDSSATNGCEVNTTNTLAHCGSCNNACPSRPGTTASCAASSCQYACNAGLADCDGNAGNGCEATLGTDSHCARCNDRCTGGATCRAGVCAVPIAGDSCLSPIPFSGTMVTAATCGGDSLYGGCGGAGTPDVFVRWTAPSSSFWILRINTGYQMAVTTGDCRTVISCHGDAIGSFFAAGSSTIIGVKSNTAGGCGTFTINATMM